MARVTKEAGEVAVGDRVYFPNSRRAVEVGSVFEQDGSVHLLAKDESAKWMMSPTHEVTVEVEEADGD